MKKLSPLYPLCALAAIALSLAACGGGGGGGNPGGGTSVVPVSPSSSAPGTSPAPSSSASPGATASPGTTSSPVPTATPMDVGSMSINGAAMANAAIVFTCGCTGEGGVTHADANGNYQITVPATAIPSSATPYTPPGHNLVVVGYNAAGAQSWTMIFLGNTSAANLNLSNTPSNSLANATDTATTAAALFVFYEANYNSHVTGSDRTFDWFNFNTIASYASHLRSSPTAHETTLMNDIVSEQSANHSLYPGYVPAWNGVAGDGVNALITNDVHAVSLDAAGGADAAAPTPCPAAGSCTGAPTP